HVGDRGGAIRRRVRGDAQTIHTGPRVAVPAPRPQPADRPRPRGDRRADRTAGPGSDAGAVVIALGLVGAAIGVLLFTVIYRWAPHRTRALVELARFDAHYHNATSTATPPLSLRSGGRDVVAWLGGHVARLAARHGISTV